MFYIFFGDKGFWAKAGGYTTKLSDAALLSRERAIEVCRNRYSPHDDLITAVPVSEELVQELVRK